MKDRRRPIGAYLTSRLKRAHQQMSWLEMAKLIPAAKANARFGHANPNWLSQLASNPQANINTPTRERLTAMLQRVLKNAVADEGEVNDPRAAAPVARPSAARYVRIRIDGREVEVLNTDVAEVLRHVKKP